MHTRFAAVLLGLGLLDVGYVNLALGPDVFLAGAGESANEPSTTRAALLESAPLRSPALPTSAGTPVTATPVPAAAAPDPSALGTPPAPGRASARDIASMPADDALIVAFPETATAALTPEARTELLVLAERLRHHPEQHLRVIGHADARGSRGYNRFLGARRARVVAELLLAAGVSGDQIDALSRGEDEPRMEGESEAAWAANRRVEISVGAERNSTP